MKMLESPCVPFRPFFRSFRVLLVGCTQVGNSLRPFAAETKWQRKAGTELAAALGRWNQLVEAETRQINIELKGNELSIVEGALSIQF